LLDLPDDRERTAQVVRVVGVSLRRFHGAALCPRRAGRPTPAAPVR
jgi:hypothetical protein